MFVHFLYKTLFSRQYLVLLSILTLTGMSEEGPGEERNGIDGIPVRWEWEVMEETAQKPSISCSTHPQLPTKRKPRNLLCTTGVSLSAVSSTRLTEHSAFCCPSSLTGTEPLYVPPPGPEGLHHRPPLLPPDSPQAYLSMFVGCLQVPLISMEAISKINIKSSN